MKRIRYIDAMRGISIILVCLGHIFPAVYVEMHPFWQWFNTFEVGIFFAISGYVMAVTGTMSMSEKTFPAVGGRIEKLTGQDEAGRVEAPVVRDTAVRTDSFGRYAWKKATGILWPYLTFSVLAFLVRIVYYIGNGTFTPDLLAIMGKEILTGSGIGALWFLPALFLGSLLAYPAMRSRIVGILIVLAAVALTYLAQPLLTLVSGINGGNIPQSVGTVCMVLIRSVIAGGIMVTGYAMAPVTERIAGLKRSARLAVILGCLAVSVAVMPFAELDFRPLAFVKAPVLMFVDVLAMLVVLVFFCRWLESLRDGKTGIFTVLEFFGKNSVIILGTHLEWFLVNVLSAGAVAVFGQISGIDVLYYIRCTFVLALLLLLEYGIIRLINSSAPWLAKWPFRKR